MRKVSTIGLDLAKNVFQAHGADASGAVIFRKKLRRAQVLEFFAAQSPCVVAMEACGGSHFGSVANFSSGRGCSAPRAGFTRPRSRTAAQDVIFLSSVIALFGSCA